MTSPESAPTTGVPVLLLHGLSQQSAFWDPVVRRMSSRPVLALDQRGHGRNDTPVDADFGVAACAQDAIDAMDDQGWDRAVVVGHSWGGAVALGAAALAPHRVAAVVLLDGGLWTPADHGDRDEVRARLTPPRLGLPADELWPMIAAGSLAPWWSEETAAALAPTFVTDDEGRMSTRLGFDRHMKVLDGLLDHDAAADIAAVGAAGTPVWAVVCGDIDDRRARAVERAQSQPGFLVHHWAGALHDVPLQWPALVAGLVDAAVEQASREAA